MWKYKIALKNKDCKIQLISKLSNLYARVYSDDNYIVIECHDNLWNDITTILGDIKGYLLFRKYYD